MPESEIHRTLDWSMDVNKDVSVEMYLEGGEKDSLLEQTLDGLPCNLFSARIWPWASTSILADSDPSKSPAQLL